MISIHASGLKKQFNRRAIFENVTFEIRPGEVFGITGKNGSGKSTLLKIMASVLAPAGGKVDFMRDGTLLEAESRYRYIGYLAPYLQLFDEFSAAENLQVFASLRGNRIRSGEIFSWLEQVGLPSDRRDPVRGYSSGMKQRMKLLFAIMHEPEVLLLDEPTTNLDRDGIETIRRVVERQRMRGCVVIATNDDLDLELCDRIYSLDTYAHTGDPEGTST